MHAQIEALASYLPPGTLSNAEIEARFPGFTEDKIYGKTGIKKRHRSEPQTYASDLGIRAGEILLERHGIDPHAIDMLILCTQSPDFLLPSTASKIHRALGLRKSAGTIDYQQGCAGYVYSLGLAKGLMETGQAQTVLLINADTVTKHIADDDRSTLSLFGDGATATLLKADARQEMIGPFVYATDGAGRDHIVSYRMGLAAEAIAASGDYPETHAQAAEQRRLYMNGPEVFRFTLAEVPELLDRLYALSGESRDTIDHFVFHQANGFMLASLRKACGIPEDRFLLAMEETGNTSSCSIPLALERGMQSGKIRKGDRLALVGFGVGYTAGAVTITL